LAEPEDIWDLVVDVTKWGDWFLGIEHVHLQGQLGVGVQGWFYLSGDTKVHQLVVNKFDLGLLEIIVDLPYRVKMFLTIDVSSTPPGAQVSLDCVFRGFFSILHTWGWAKSVKVSLAPITRRLGILSQSTGEWQVPRGY
jgi:hypothetical protein